ncbi:probable ATP-dependent RNA helicase DDX4 [Protopterus annectens]|uniref:probable ATP-dependent RNA helicase DDX4 n=1 Tax=Protopterus annectens TaxID=7888 RepID=UPI001CFB56F7|nr:probable ATP-dependent RNA helicase DDX4 [Protopterus annectens]
MGDENWEEELESTNTTSFVPNFKNLDLKDEEFGSDEVMSSQGNVPDRDQSGSRRGFSAFGRPEEFGSDGNRRGRDGAGARRGNTRGGFGERLRGFNEHLEYNGERRGNSAPRRGVPRGGFGLRVGGFGDSHDEEVSRGNSGPRRGNTRGGFARKEGAFMKIGPLDCSSGFDKENNSGSHNREGTTGSRGGPRGGFNQVRGGGYKGKDEEMMSGFNTEKAPWKSGKEKDEDPEVRRSTYIPPPPPEEEDAIFAHYQTGINFDKYDEILVNVTGQGVPAAILTFEEAGFNDVLNKNIAKTGYAKPTPVQKHAIPIVLSGRDLMACAQTGSGKTAAFLLPILAQMMVSGVSASKFQELQEPEAIIIAPTRELICQIYLEARKFAYGTCVRSVVVYGGTNTGYSIRQISQGCNILCATPGRLHDIIGKGRIGLTKVRYLVLDEADRMLEMGFIPDVKKLVTSPGMPAKEARQTLMFSATFPEEIQRIHGEFRKSDQLFVSYKMVGATCRNVKGSILRAGELAYEVKECVVQVFRHIGSERTMVFVATKKQADFIATYLCQVNLPTTSIHGDREQREREEALRDFRSGKCPILVATSVAARGLDIENVQHVINFDLPEGIDEYVHRIGRTGRCGNVGKAISFFDPTKAQDVSIAQSLVKVLADAHQDVPSWLEEIAFGTHGATYSNPRGNVFSSVDSRKEFGGSKHFNTIADRTPVTNEEDESWE